MNLILLFILAFHFLMLSGYAISRIRKFYMRKVKYTAQNIHDKLSAIIQDFPVLDVRFLSFW